MSAAEAVDLAARGGLAGDREVALSRVQAQEVSSIRTAFSIDGLWVRDAGERDYPLGALASPIVGFVENGKGAAGVERSLEKELAGRQGVTVGLTDRAGRFLPWLIHEAETTSVQDGQDVVLTVRSDLQAAAMRSLEAQCRLHAAESGAAIVIDPKTGDLLALATWPTFDPARALDAKGKAVGGSTVSPQLNPAAAYAYEPGSTFKTFAIALGLDSGTITLNSQVVCTGTKTFAGKPTRCAGDHKPKAHGTVTPAVCVEASCNIAAATWGAEIGFQKMSRMIEDLGLLKPTKFGLAPEDSGVLNYEDYNKTLQCSRIAFGQSLTTTPIALAGAFTAFANGGKRVTPRLIKRVGHREMPIAKPVQVFSKEVADVMLSMMEEVIHGDHGTGKSLRLEGHRLAGKTGTAQKYNGIGGKYVSSFVGYVPAREPRAVVLVMVDSPSRNGYYGAVVAGPVFREISKFLIKEYKIPAIEAVRAVALP
jgi:cell division protein FtsI/penicillin-binding protein 2